VAGPLGRRLFKVYHGVPPRSKHMSYKELDTVVLTCDLPDYGLRTGDLGTVVYCGTPDHLDVEFVIAAGRTQAVVTLSEAAVRPLGDDLMSVRPAEPPAHEAD
jgi:hypothetical protein